MNRVINIGLFALLLCAVLPATGQQDPQYTQYMYNMQAVNPAYAGSRGNLSVVGLHRSQWVGLEGAPETQSLSVHSPIGLGRVGLGLSLVRDELGPSRETYMMADFSYTINTSERGRLAFGLKAGAHLLDVDFTKLDVFFPGDPRLQQNIDDRLSPVVGVGLYYHTEDWYVGLSAPNLLQTDHFDESNNSNSTSFVAEERIHYFLTAGYVFELSDSVLFKPATLVKAVSGAPLQLDVSANFLFSERFTLGAAWRWDAAVSGLVGYQISDQLMLGFAYDRETTDLGNTKFNDGSYEVFLRFDLFRSYDRLLTPRFF